MSSIPNANSDNDAILGTLTQIASSLKVTALLRLAEEFYSREERVDLYKEYKELREEDERTRLAYVDAGPADRVPWEERVAKYGEAVAREHFKDVEAAHKIRQAAMERVSAFEREHRILMRLLDARNELSKGKYD